jgi:hypothetical protein
MKQCLGDTRACKTPSPPAGVGGNRRAMRSPPGEPTLYSVLYRYARAEIEVHLTGRIMELLEILKDRYGRRSTIIIVEV